MIISIIEFKETKNVNGNFKKHIKIVEGTHKRENLQGLKSTLDLFKNNYKIKNDTIIVDKVGDYQELIKGIKAYYTGDTVQIIDVK
jgi:hypothetical protein